MSKAPRQRTARAKKANPAKPTRQRQDRSNAKGMTTAEAAARSWTKQDYAIAMLRSKDGASIAALMDATGWQQHSVRGFLAGVVRKRLGLPLQSTKIDGARVYRIAGSDGAKPKAAADQQALSSA